MRTLNKKYFKEHQCVIQGDYDRHTGSYDTEVCDFIVGDDERPVCKFGYCVVLEMSKLGLEVA